MRPTFSGKEMRIACLAISIAVTVITLLTFIAYHPVSREYARRRLLEHLGATCDCKCPVDAAAPSTTTQHVLADNRPEAADGILTNPEYDHQQSARVPRDPLVVRQCDAVAPWQLYQLASGMNYFERSDPVFFHFHGGNLVHEENRTFAVTDEFCTVFLVPQSPPSNESDFRNAAIEGWGPDSIHAEMSSDDVRIMLPLPEFWGYLSPPRTIVGDPLSLAVYLSAYRLNHPGTYQVSGEVEFSNYDWVMEDSLNLNEQSLPYVMFNHTLQAHSPSIDVAGIPVSRPDAQCYHQGHTDMRGRWYRASSFNSEGNQTALNPGAHLDFAEHNTTVDFWGWTFAPDHCSLTFFTAEDHMSCLDSRTVQVLGDSNSRRVLKSIMGGGISWCQDPQERMCQCEDHWQTEFQDVNWDTIDATYFKNVDLREDPIKFGRNSSAYFDFIGGLLNQKLFNGWHFFYDSKPGSPSILEQRQKNHGPIDVVHVSYIGWDMASIRTPNEWMSEFDHFRDHLLASYPPGTRFNHRLANNMCCGNQNHKTRYSAPRFAMWNALYREWWRRDEDAGIHNIIDVTALQGRRDAETQFYCPTTHMRSSHVRIEQMMWLGAVCQRDASGAMKLRNDTGLKKSFLPASNETTADE